MPLTHLHPCKLFLFFFVRKATPENPVSTEVIQRFQEFLTAEDGAEGLPLLLSGLKEEGGTSLDFISLDSIHNSELLPAYTDYDANDVDKGFLLFKHKVKLEEDRACTKLKAVLKYDPFHC